jgi:hypothetical protein
MVQVKSLDRLDDEFPETITWSCMHGHMFFIFPFIIFSYGAGQEPGW